MTKFDFSAENPESIMRAIEELQRAMVRPGTSTQSVCERLDVLIWLNCVIACQNAMNLNRK